METAKRYFILVVFVGILCVPVRGDIQVLKSGEQQQVKRPWGVLTNLDTIDTVDMTILCPDPNKDTKFWKKLYSKVTATFPERIRFQPVLRSYTGNIYKIRIEIFEFEGSFECVARIRSTLSSYVSIKNGSVLADVWKTEPAIKVMQLQNLHEAVSAAVLEQVEEFVNDYQKANPSAKCPLDVNDISMVPKGQARLTAGVTPAKYEYVASKNSKVFHRPDCSSAKRIKSENLVGYSSRNEAIKTGKRPCKLCSP